MARSSMQRVGCPASQALQVTQLKDDISARVAGVREEALAQREATEAKINGVVARIESAEDAAEELRGMTRELSKRRVDDMELVDKAIATAHAQHARFRGLTNNALRALAADVRALHLATKATESAVTAVQMDTSQVKRGVAFRDVDTQRRFDGINEVLSLLSSFVADDGATTTR